MLKVVQLAFAVACFEAYQMPTIVQVEFKWLHLSLAETDSQLYITTRLASEVVNMTKRLSMVECRRMSNLG